MKPILLKLSLALSLAPLLGCQPEPPTDPVAPAESPASEPAGMSEAELGPAEGMAPEDLGPAVGMGEDDMGPPSIMSPSDVDPASGPSFDCAKASGDVERMVCQDPALAALDRELDALYTRLQSKAGDRDAFVATQRGWVKGRDECWKDSDAPRCVREAYQTRLVELQLDSGEVVVPTPVAFRCGDGTLPFTAVYYNDIEPRAAVLTWGDDQAIVFPDRSASGAKYGRQGVSFWEHQGEAQLDFFGKQATCQPIG